MKKFGKDYLTPQYYNKILKKYSSGNFDDLAILKTFINKDKLLNNILELGCGTGRATKVLCENINFKKLVLTDISQEMLDYTRELISVNKNNKIEYKRVDHIKYLLDTKEKFDLVISYWSYAHSVYPCYEKYTFQAESLIKSILIKFIIMNIEKNGRLLMIQTDGDSEEQRIVKNCWFIADSLKEHKNIQKEYYKEYISPANYILRGVYKDLVKSKILDIKTTKIIKIIGNSVKYKDIDDAIEIFMNFHLEGKYNNSDIEKDIISYLKQEFERIIKKKGELRITTGYFVFQAQKV